MGEISRAVDDATANPAVQAILFTAEGRHFCSGASASLIDRLIEAPPLTVQDNVYATAQGMVRRIYNCPKPTVAAVSGAAVTLGCELAIACDFRVVDETAFFQEAWFNLGLLPPLGGMFLLPRIVGAGRAAEMVLLGRKVQAEEALGIGLANEMVPSAKLVERASSLATLLGQKPPQAYRLAKSGLHRGFESTMEAEWSANSMAQALLMSSEDFVEGVNAARERRQAVFRGC